MKHGSTGISPLAPRSEHYKGPFGRICRELPPWQPRPDQLPDDDGLGQVERIDEYLKTIARGRMVEAPGKTPGEIASDDELRNELEATFASRIPAAYTYFGQFVDHDITFDPVSSLMRRNDPNALENFRTPRLDLDNVYGRGPHDQPYMYFGDKFRIGEVGGSELPDLPRHEGTALIGDMRNDENSIVAQIQLAFLLAHNTLVDRAQGEPDPFLAAQRTLRWLYQHIVWNDFLPRVTIDAVHACALRLEDVCHERKRWVAGLRDVYSWSNTPFMPVEFSVAAYRFGHSMVRNSYQTNHPKRGFGEFVPIFDSAQNPDDLRGFRPLEERNYVQWDWFLDMGNQSDEFPQRARKIDTKLSNALSALPNENAPNNVLAFRNLKRGWTFDLPSGTDVARKLCIKETTLEAQEPDALWYYILKEAESIPGANAGESLGRLGSTIVCAVFAGLLLGDPRSYLNIEPCWTPDQDPLLIPGQDDRDGGWTLASIIRLSGLPITADDFT